MSHKYIDYSKQISDTVVNKVLAKRKLNKDGEFTDKLDEKERLIIDTIMENQKEKPPTPKNYFSSAIKGYESAIKPVEASKVDLFGSPEHEVEDFGMEE